MADFSKHEKSAKDVLRERAVTPISKAAIPLGDELIAYHYIQRGQERSTIKELKDIYRAIAGFDTAIQQFIAEHHPQGKDDDFMRSCIYGQQIEIARNWSMKVGYVLDDLEQTTRTFSLHVDRMMAEPWTNYGKVKAAYEEVARRAKQIINDYYNILELKTCHALRPQFADLRPTHEEQKNMIARIDALASSCLDTAQNGLDRMRELYFKFSDHRSAELSTQYAAISAQSAKAAASLGRATVVISLVGLVIGIISMLTPIKIKTSETHPIDIIVRPQNVSHGTGGLESALEKN